jgi:hypothetical protein
MRIMIIGILLAQLAAYGAEGSVLSAAGGRYVFGQLSLVRADQYLLDTKEGRLWIMSVDANGTHVLIEVAFENGRDPATPGHAIFNPTLTEAPPKKYVLPPAPLAPQEPGNK